MCLDFFYHHFLYLFSCIFSLSLLKKNLVWKNLREEKTVEIELELFFLSEGQFRLRSVFFNAVGGQFGVLMQIVQMK